MRETKKQLRDERDAAIEDRDRAVQLCDEFRNLADALEENVRDLGAALDLETERERFVQLRFYQYRKGDDSLARFGTRKLIEATTIPVSGASFQVGPDETLECYAEEVL